MIDDLTDLHLYEVGSEPVYDLQVGGKVSVGVEDVLVGLLLVAVVVVDGAHLLQNCGISWGQAERRKASKEGKELSRNDLPNDLKVPLHCLAHVPHQLV